MKPAYFPFALGLVVMAVPHIFHAGFDAAGINDTLAGFALAALALFAGRSWPVRAAQALLGVWIALAPFFLETLDYVLYAGVIMGKVIVLSSLVPSQMFEAME